MGSATPRGSFLLRRSIRGETCCSSPLDEPGRQADATSADPDMHAEDLSAVPAAHADGISADSAAWAMGIGADPAVHAEGVGAAPAERAVFEPGAGPASNTASVSQCSKEDVDEGHHQFRDAATRSE